MLGANNCFLFDKRSNGGVWNYTLIQKSYITLSSLVVFFSTEKSPLRLMHIPGDAVLADSINLLPSWRRPQFKSVARCKFNAPPRSVKYKLHLPLQRSYLRHYVIGFNLIISARGTSLACSVGDKYIVCACKQADRPQTHLLRRCTAKYNNFPSSSCALCTEGRRDADKRCMQLRDLETDTATLRSQ